MTRLVGCVMVPVAAGAVIVGAAIVAAAAPASAQVHDGHIDVVVRNVTIPNVSVGVGGITAAQMCGMEIGPVVVLAVEVDGDSMMRWVCDSNQGTVMLQQNASGE